MILVERAPEPAAFDTRVRQRGKDAIAELVGEPRSKARRGPKRKQAGKFATRDDIPFGAFPPYWRDALPDMLDSYNRLCAYLSLHIEHATGNPTVDHVIPKSKSWNQVYEWSNYRLACALMNSRKGVTEQVLDPFEIQDDWFALEFLDYQVCPGPGASGDIEERVEVTIETLGLNDAECCRARGEYIESYLADEPIPFSYVQRRAPFIARELERQGRLRSEDM